MSHIHINAACGEFVLYLGIAGCHGNLSGTYYRIPESELVGAADPAAVIAKYAKALLPTILKSMEEGGR